MSKIVKIILWTLAGLLCLLLPGLYNPLNLVRYEIKAKGLTHPIRIALVTDLHSCAYGPDQRELLDAIDREKPDLILLGGDIYDDDLPDGNTLTFLKGVSSNIPAIMCQAITNIGGIISAKKWPSWTAWASSGSPGRWFRWTSAGTG